MQFEMLQFGLVLSCFRLLGWGQGKIHIQAVFHQNLSSEFVLCVTLPGKWNLKTLMRATKDMTVSEAQPSLKWNWKMSSWLIFDRANICSRQMHPPWSVALFIQDVFFSPFTLFWIYVYWLFIFAVVLGYFMPCLCSGREWWVWKV